MNDEVVALRKAPAEAEWRWSTDRLDNTADIAKSATAPQLARCLHLVRCALPAIVVAPSALVAQPDSTREGEVSAYAGVFGIGSHPAVGAGTGAAFARYATALIEISYMPLSSDTLLSTPLLGVYRSSGLYDFSLCADIRIPVRKRWAPYGLNRYRSPLRRLPGSRAKPVGARFANRSKTNFEFSTGGGVRYYVKDNWGIRPKVRVFHQPPDFSAAGLLPASLWRFSTTLMLAGRFASVGIAHSPAMGDFCDSHRTWTVGPASGTRLTKI
jgi:hypothetical protein